MRFFWFPLFLLLLFGCTNSKTNRSNLLDFVPKNTSVIVKTTNLESFKSSLANSDFLQTISKAKSYRNLQNKLKGLSALNPSGEILICFSNDNNDSLQYSVITKRTQGLFQKDSLPNYIEETLSYKNKTITKSTLDNTVFYSTIIDSTFFASSSKAIVDNLYNSTNKNIDLEKIYNTTNEDKTCSVILAPNHDFINTLFIEDSLSLKLLTHHIAADIEINQNDIYFNGVTKANDSLKSLINIFKNSIPQENQIQDITPSNSDGFMSFTFDDFEIFENNISKFNARDSIANTTSLFDDVIEIGVIYEDAKRAIVLNSIDNIATNDALLSEQTVLDSYRGIKIYNFSKPTLFSKTFNPLVTYNNANVYCVLDHFFVFSDSKGMLQNIIANYQNKTTYSNKAYFKTIKEKLTDASSLLQVMNASTLKSVINKNLKNNPSYKLNNYNASAIQFIYDNNYAHVNGIVKKAKTKASINSISEELNIKLDTDLLINPQFVTNHTTKQKDIVVQDINNNLYLISNKGKILWKKQLQGPVLGEVEQIDIYKNGRLQLAFATPKRVYVLDRNGKEVKQLSLKFKNEITQPLAVFDYDKRKNYRLLVTQGKRVFMYDGRGKNVKGFKFKSAKKTIVSQPKHFRIGAKDYITIKTQKKLYILDRTGKLRVKPKKVSAFSNQPVFLFNNTFTTTTTDGNLVSVDTKGNVSTRALNLGKNHYIQTTSKTLIAHSENKLIIKGKIAELDFGQYSPPKLFYINDNIYVSITDLQSNKIYLYDSQSRLQPNFPVYGNSSIELDNIDKDKNLEFVTKGESNAIILYQIN